MGFDGAVFFRFLIAALATWRVAFLLVRERGPADVFERLRRVITVSVVAEAMKCVKCTGMWVAIPFAVFVRSQWPDVVVVWLADPEDSTITVYRADRAPRVYQPEEELTEEEVLPGFRQRVGDFFRAPGEDQTGPDE